MFFLKTRDLFAVSLILLGLFVTEIALEMYAPSLPQIMEYFGTTEAYVNATVGINALGLALSGLIYGPLSEYYGRRRILLIGLTIFTFASILGHFASYFETITPLIFVRCLQGLGAGAAGVIGLAVMKDMFSGEQYARMMSLTGMVIAIIPGIGPILGGYIAAYYNWNMVFTAIAVLSVIALVLIYLGFPETLKKKEKGPISFRSILKDYHQLLKIKKFRAYVLIISFIHAIWWCEFAYLPYYLIDKLGLSAKYYGYFAAIGVLAYMVGTFFNRYFLTKATVSQVLQLGLYGYLGSFIISLITFYLWPESIVMIRVSLMLIAFSGAMVSSNTYSLALESAPKPGVGSAFIVPAEMLMGALCIFLMSQLYNDSLIPYLFCGLVLSIIAVIILKRAQN
jgi:MFS transporter, DHA1 family, multidrug resistance protein